MPMGDVRGTTVHYEVAGAGTPLVLLLPQSKGPAGTDKLIDGLAGKHTIITCELRGTGRNDPLHGELSMASMAEDVVAVLDALDPGPVHLVCHSTGCGIGLSLAAGHADRVAALVLATPWTHADDHLHTMQTLRKAAARALDPEQYARFNAALLFPPDFRRLHAAGFARMAAEAPAKPQDADDIARRLDAILAFDARALWPAIRCPTLVVAARDDQLMPPWFAEEAAQHIEGAELAVFDGGGHMLPETRTEDFTETVLGFLSRELRGQST